MSIPSLHIHMVDICNEQTVLWSAKANSQLKVLFTRRKTFADRAFSVAAPKWWNELPDSIKDCDTIDSFKAKLKTHLFDKF